MNRMYTGIALCLAISLLLSGGFYNVFADHDNRDGHEKWEKRHSKHDGQRDATVVTNSIYTETCGACHLPYQPSLLPSGSWAKILKGLSDHFGETVEIDPETAETITGYLKTNAADLSSAKLSRKIMKSIGNEIPIRITQVPYIRKEHHEIRASVFERKSIGSFSNCMACHKTAEKGIYDDDLVTIPR